MKFAARALALVGALTLSAPLAAQDNPVVVELYTSQGCSSCPLADAVFLQLTENQKNIVAKEKVDQLISEADKALYHAKDSGRNCIKHFSNN